MKVQVQVEVSEKTVAELTKMAGISDRKARVRIATAVRNTVRVTTGEHRIELVDKGKVLFLKPDRRGKPVWKGDRYEVVGR